MAAKKWKKRQGGKVEERVKIRRVNINLEDEEETELYLDMRQYAAEDRKTLHDFVLELFRKEQQRRKSRGK